MLLLGAAGWAGALAGRWWDWWALVALVPGLAALGAAAARGRGPRWTRTTAAAVLVLAAVATVAALRGQLVTDSPVARLAAERAAVSVIGTVTSDPRRTEGA